MSRKYFESLGRQHFSMGHKRWPAHYKHLPAWVRESMVAGYTAQMPSRHLIDARKSELAAASMSVRS